MLLDHKKYLVHLPIFPISIGLVRFTLRWQEQRSGLNHLEPRLNLGAL